MKRSLCPHCRRRLEPAQKIHDECLAPWADAREAKAARVAAKAITMHARAEKAKDRRRKAEQMTIPELKKLADRWFGAFIRERDRKAGHACISSGRPLDWNAGNKVDAGHYRSKGAARHLRYHEDNCHAQTKQENRFKAGNAVDYRIRLIERIGVERVEALESNNEIHHWTKDELLAVIAKYRALANQMKKEREA